MEEATVAINKSDNTINGHGSSEEVAKAVESNTPMIRYASPEETRKVFEKILEEYKELFERLKDA